MKEKEFLITYILGIIFLIALVILKNIKPINYILLILVGAAINIMAVLYFSRGVS